MTDQLHVRARALAADAPRFRTRCRVLARRVFNGIAAAYGEPGLEASGMWCAGARPDPPRRPDDAEKES